MRRKSIVGRFSTLFAVLYVIPMLVSLYLLLPLLDLAGKAAQVTFLFVFLVLLGLAGRLILRTIVRSLEATVEAVEAMGKGLVPESFLSTCDAAMLRYIVRELARRLTTWTKPDSSSTSSESSPEATSSDFSISGL